ETTENATLPSNQSEAAREARSAGPVTHTAPELPDLPANTAPEAPNSFLLPEQLPCWSSAAGGAPQEEEEEMGSAEQSLTDSSTCAGTRPLDAATPAGGGTDSVAASPAPAAEVTAEHPARQEASDRSSFDATWRPSAEGARGEEEPVLGDSTGRRPEAAAGPGAEAPAATGVAAGSGLPQAACGSPAAVAGAALEGAHPSSSFCDAPLRMAVEGSARRPDAAAPSSADAPAASAGTGPPAAPQDGLSRGARVTEC
ncbi:unnamed protein product, partial [Prorocentrum cordatum]